MILIGERINTGFKDIKNAVINKDPEPIKMWAKKQAEAKANYIDVNLGAVSAKPEDLCWMIDIVQNTVDVPISIDTNKLLMMKEAIPVCKKPPLLNSVTADENKLDEIFPIISKYNASVIGLAIDESGTPKSAEKRVEKAGFIFSKAADHGISPEKLFLDPIVMPLKFMQDQAKEILNAASQFKLFSDPPCHIVCGLSNISNGTLHKKLINRIFATMMIANGLDAIILDVTDEDLVNSILTAELIMNKSIYADSYIEAFRK